MIRKIIEIDENKCNGCGLCVNACQEGALALVNGKAKLMREDYCDGLGNCLPACPQDAITFVEREAMAFDEKSVKKSESKPKLPEIKMHEFKGCPGSRMQTLRNNSETENNKSVEVKSMLSQWPVQIKLLAPNAYYYNNADILVAADCTAYAYGNFHNDFIKGKITMIGCPKLDNIDYTEKLTAIFSNNDIKSVTVTRMSVPCCGGIEMAVRNAVINSGKDIKVMVYTIDPNGNIMK